MKLSTETASRHWVACSRKLGQSSDFWKEVKREDLTPFFVAYAEWLSEQSGRRYRLPSEAEWEYACRADIKTPWSFGNNEADLAQYAWFGGNSDGQTHPVGEKKPNPWGLHDVHGNVLEWVQDCWHGNYEGAPGDGSPWEEARGGNCGRRVLRGGSWGHEPGFLSSADRLWNFAVNRFNLVGFRLAQDL